MSIRVDLAGSKIAITSAKIAGFFFTFLDTLAALKLGFMRICAVSHYSDPVQS